MIMTWTLLMISITGSWSADVNFHSIPMANKDACVRAAEWAAKNSSGQMGYICVSSETGEVIKVSK